MLRRIRLYVSLPLLAALAPGMAQSQAALPQLQTGQLQAAAVDQAPNADREAEALALKAAGRYAAALAAFSALVADPPAAADEAIRVARAEFHVEMVHTLASRISAIEVRDRLLEFADEHPFAARSGAFRDRCVHGALALAASAGDHGQVAELTQRLGFLGEWSIIGPFDNERGSGFGRSFAPETEFVADARYDGKKRAVHWRRLPDGIALANRGVVDLNAILRPNDQVLAYAATALTTVAAQTVVLHLGSDESVKVFLNGTELFARDARRRFAIDQDAVALPLQPGTNLLVLKVCEQEGGWAFAGRLRNLDGSPVNGVTASSDFAQLTTASAQEPAPQAADTSIDRGALTTLAAALEAEDADPEDAIRLGALLGLNHPDDETERRDFALAERAVRALPQSTQARYLLAFTRQREGASETRDENARRADYEWVIAKDPAHAEALRALAELELSSAGNADRAVQLLRRALEINPDYHRARHDLARAYESLELEGLASLELRRAAAVSPEGYCDAAALAAQRVELRRAQLRHEAHANAAHAMQRAQDARTVADYAWELTQIGRRETALEALDAGIAHYPFANWLTGQLANMLRSVGDYDAALTAYARWLEICPEDDDALVEVAQLHRLAGDREREREFLARALELNPNRKREQRLLEFLRTDEAPFYAAFAIDADLESLAAELAVDPETVAKSNDPYVHLVRHAVVRAYRNGTTSRYQHSVMQVTSEEGARGLTTFFVPHFWGEQRARLLEVQVRKADGSLLRPRVQDYYVQFPPLSVGDVCSLKYRVDDVAPTIFGDYFGLEHLLTADDGSAVRHSILDLVLDPGRTYRIQPRNGAPEPVTVAGDAEAPTTHRFELRDVPRRKLEERRPSVEEFEPLVRVTTYAEWSEFANWWWNLIRKQTEVTPAMREKVAELTADAATDMDKIRAIYRFVTTEIRYEAWEFGVHGYKPYSTSVIFERRHGDCKDKSLLLNAMLSEVDIEAYPVLIFADPRRSADDLTLPMVQHFNHCISYLPATEGREAMYLDGTATYHPVDTLPEMDQGAQVLVVAKGDGEVRTIDWVAALENRDERTFEVALENDGSALVEMTWTPTRNQAVAARDALANEPAKRKERIERELSSAMGAVEVLSVETSDLLDLDVPVRVVVKFRAEDIAAVQDGGLVLRPYLMPRSLQALASAQERERGLLLGVPSADLQHIRYAMPKGYGPVEIPADVEADENFGSFHSRWTRGPDGKLVIDRSQALTTHRIEPAEYPDFRTFASEIGRADQRVVVIKPNGGR